MKPPRQPPRGHVTVMDSAIARGYQIHGYFETLWRPHPPLKVLNDVWAMIKAGWRPLGDGDAKEGYAVCLTTPKYKRIYQTRIFKKGTEMAAAWRALWMPGIERSRLRAMKTDTGRLSSRRPALQNIPKPRQGPPR